MVAAYRHFQVRALPGFVWVEIEASTVEEDGRLGVLDGAFASINGLWRGVAQAAGRALSEVRSPPRALRRRVRSDPSRVQRTPSCRRREASVKAEVGHPENTEVRCPLFIDHRVL